MKPSRFVRFVLSVGVLAVAWNAPASSTVDDNVKARIDRVVNGLLPNTHIKHRFAAEASLQERMAHYHTPGVSIAVVNNYRIEWARGFGVKEWGKSGKITERTLFQAGSISKPMFALAVMRLAQEGCLDLDRDVNDYLTSWKVPPNDLWQPRITLCQILTHSAGLTVHGFPGYSRSERIPTVPQILDGEAPANTGPVRVNLLPGSQIRYSGGGTTIGQLAVADLLKKPFQEIMRETLLLPLRMGNSTYEQPLPKALHKHAATAHPWRYRPLDGKWHAYPEMAAAGLWTTPSDLARAGIELQLALKGDTQRFLLPGQATRMLDGRNTENVALGFMLVGEGKTQRFTHGGWDEGFVAQMTMYRENGMGAVIMINSNEGDAMLQEIERAIAREYHWPDYFVPEKRLFQIDSALAEACVGEYTGPRGFEAAITRHGEKLFFQPKGQNPIPLQADANTNLFATVLNLDLNLTRDTNGVVTTLICDQNSRKLELKRKTNDVAGRR